MRKNIKTMQQNLHKGLPVALYAFLIVSTAFIFSFPNIQIAQAITGTVTGRILANGIPVGQYDVFINVQEPFGPPIVPGEPTQSDGTFSIPNVPAGNYQITTYLNSEVISSNYMSVTVDNVSVGAGVTNVGDIALVKATKTITGQVTLKGTSTPVTDAFVSVFCMDGNPVSKNAAVNNSGVYTMKVSGQCRWGSNVSGGWNEYGQPIAVDWIYAGMPQEAQFTNDNSTESKTINFGVVEANATVKGTVKYPDGSPVQNLGVNLNSQSGGNINTQTNSSGFFSMKTPAGAYELNAWFPPDQQQFSFPRIKVTVAEDQTLNLGTITISEKTSQISGKVLTEAGAPVPNANLNAFSMGSSNGDFSWTQTDAQGRYTLWVGSGRYGVQVQQSPDSPYVSSETQKEFEIAEGQALTGVNFTMILADVTINGSVVNEAGDLVSDFYGYAQAMEPMEGNKGPGPQQFFGSPIQGGQFSIRIPSDLLDRVSITSFVEPGRPYSIQNSVELDIAPNGTYNVQLVLVPNDATVAGRVVDNYGNPVSGFEFGEVYIMSKDGQWNHSQINEDGSYFISLRSGEYEAMGAHIEGGNYIEQPPKFEDGGLIIAKGQTQKNITILKADAQIKGTLLAPDGSPYEGFGWAFAHEEFDESKGEDFKDSIESGTEVRNGRFTLNVVGGKTYFMGAGVPPDASDNNWMRPQEEFISVKAGETKTVTLRFKQADGSITGTIVYEDGSPVEFGFVDGWSEDGANSGAEIFNGEFNLPVTQNTIWNVNGMTFNGSDFYSSGETRVRTPEETGFSIEKNLVVVKSQFRFPEAKCETWDSTQPKTIGLSDGSSVNLPAGSLATDGNVTVCGQPTVNLKSEKDNQPAKGFGYSFTATDANNQAITEFNSAVTISFPVESDLLEEQGLTPQDLLPAFFNTTTNTWERVTNFAYNTDTDMITFSITHFTDFSLVTGAGGVDAAGPQKLLVAPQAGGGPHLKLYDSSLNFSSEFMAYAPGFRGGIHATSADLDGDGIDEIITVPASNGGPHLRVFDADGIELAGEFATTPGYRSGFQVTSGDVDGDGNKEIILGANVGGGPQVIVYSYANNALTKDAVFYAYQSNLKTGIQVATGDTDGDGVDEIITSANQGAGPHIRVFSGNGTSEGGFFAYPSHLRNGVTISIADVDNDGVDEIISAPGKGSPANIAVWTADGGMKSGFYALPETNHGGVTAQAIDVDSDGTMEIITTPLHGNGPQISIFDWEGNVERRFFAYQEWLRTGVVATAQDIDNDGDVEIITAPGEGGGPLISVFDANGNALKRFYSHTPAFKKGVELKLGNE